MKLKVISIIVLFSCTVIGFVVFKNPNHTANLWEPLIPNRLLIGNESVVSAFSFAGGEALQIDAPFTHYKLILTDLRRLGVLPELSQATKNGQRLMITIETWGPDLLIPFKRNPLSLLINGEFDTVIIQLCTQISNTQAKVYLRFNPEMEVPGNSYPWQNNLIDYIKAYRHFAGLTKQYAPQAILTWAPAGYPGTMEFYPGDDVVDAASITIKSNSEKELLVYPNNYSIPYDLQRRLHRLRFVDKPIFVFASDSIKGAIDNYSIDLFAKHFQKEKEVIYSSENFNRHGTVHTNPPDTLIIGLYDPQNLLVDDSDVSAEHLFVDFSRLLDGSFENDFRNVVERQHMLIITFEPFRHPDSNADPNVLANLAEGKYDRELSDFYNIICSTNRRIYLRFAHEMEIPITRYPWQSRDPVTYIHSFRYFMQFRDSSTDHIQRVWGPAGDRGSVEWYPGNDVVDVVSFAVYGLPDKNITNPNLQESFGAIFNRKKWRLRFIDKPLFITEFGVKGPEEYQTNWLLSAAEVIKQNDNLIGINYFNMSDTPKAWGDIKPPDWSISKASFNKFTEQLKRK